MAKMTKKDFFSDGFLNAPRFGREHLGVPSDPFEQAIMAARREAKAELPKHNEKLRKEIAKQMAEEEKVRKNMDKRHNTGRAEMSDLDSLLAGMGISPSKTKTSKPKVESQSSNKVLDSIARFFKGETDLRGREMKPEDNVSFNAVGKVRPGENPGEIDRAIARMANTATLQASNARAKMTGDQNTLDAFFSQREFGEGGGKDILSDMAGYIIPGAGAVQGLRALGVGAKVAPGASIGQKALQYGKEGAMVGAGIGMAETPGMALANPDQTALDHLKRIGLETAFGAVADPAIMGAVGLGKRGLGALDSLKSAIPDVSAPNQKLSSVPTTKVETPRTDAFTVSKIKEREAAFVKEQKEAFNTQIKSIQQQAKKDLGEFKATLKNTEDSFVRSRLEESGYSNQVAQYDEVVKKSKGELDRIKSIVGDKIFIPKENRADFPEFPKGYISAKADGRYDIYKATEEAGFGQDVEGFARHMRNLLDASQTRKKDVITLDTKKMELDARNEFKQSQEYKALQDTFNQIKRGYDEQISQYKNITDEQIQSSFSKTDEYKAISNSLDQIASGPQSNKGTPSGIAGSPTASIRQTPMQDAIDSMGMQSSVKSKKPIETPISKAWNKASQHVSDGTVYLKKIENELKKIPRFRGQGKAYENFSTAKGSAAYSDKILSDQFIPVLDKIRNEGHSATNGFQYVTALRLKEVATKNPGYELPDGLTMKGIDDTINMFKDVPAFQEFSDSLRKFNNDLLDILVEGGRISKAQRDKLVKENPNYQPLFREQDLKSDEFEDIMLGYYGIDRGTSKQPINSLKSGSKDPIADPVDSYIRNVQNMVYSATQNKAMQNLLDLQKLDVDGKYLKKAGPKETGENVVTVWRDGKPQNLKLHDELANAVAVAKKVGKPDLASNLLLSGAKLQRTSVTANLNFLVRDMPRNFKEGWVNGDWSMFKDLPLATLDVFSNGKLLGDKSLLDTYYKHGAGQNTVWSQDRNKFEEIQKRAYKGEFKKNIIDVQGGKAGEAFQSVVDGWRKVLDSSEQLFKMAQFRSTLRKGDPNKNWLDDVANAPTELKDKAAFDARDLMDWMKQGQTLGNVNRYVAFINSNIRSKDKLGRSLMEKPLETFTKLVIANGIPSVLAYTLYDYASERQQQIMDESPDWLKDTYHLFPHPMRKDDVIRIPKSHEGASLISAPLEYALREARGKNDVELQDEVARWVATNVFIGMDLNPLMPLMEVGMNKSKFSDREIIPKREQNMKPSEQGDVHTSSLAKGVSNVLGKVPMVRDVQATSPRMIDHLIKGYAPGSGEMALDTIDKILENAGIRDVKKPEGSGKNIMTRIADQFVVEGDKSYSRYVNTMYETQSKMQDEKRKYDERDEEYPFAATYTFINKSIGQNGEFSTLTRQIDNSKELTPAEKKEARANVTNQRNELVRQLKELGLFSKDLEDRIKLEKMLRNR